MTDQDMSHGEYQGLVTRLREQISHYEAKILALEINVRGKDAEVAKCNVFKVRAKVRCSHIERTEFNDNLTQVKVYFSAIHGTEGENADFAKATPSGACWMQLDPNVHAAKFLKPNNEYYMTFTDATPAPSPPLS